MLFPRPAARAGGTLLVRAAWRCLREKSHNNLQIGSVNYPLPSFFFFSFSFFSPINRPSILMYTRQLISFLVAMPSTVPEEPQLWL